ncbi:H-NS family nucleoid-associated regulatory protein [Vibrio vulnificus]|uniref:H-NS family histone-like protein n=1 Tax=Vibrio vulnificus TaxID=672 RepID=UPI000C99B06E|nr:H-NS family nucleoid-associated regulatory protein [Vibrio vulnificus]PNG68652.1 DNA-binding protein [Vibrio vulnificus]HDY7474819.1 H-NS histone family protein [Vibrio vulnificus]HDY7818464.1 H-NS histone family protein [Vibrio vulnificus]
MNEILKSLSSPRRAKAMFKHASVDQVNLMIKTLQDLRDEKELEAKMAAEIEERERQELEALRAQILEKNIDFNKLSALMGENKKPRKNSSKRTSTKPSVTYTYGDNEVWDGVGEVPAALQSLLEEGFELSDFVQPA